MKLKNSSILLIVVAIFLLISIGSVCASENITDTSDDTLADDGTDVVLSNTDTDDNVADDTTQEKVNTTVETEKDNYEFKQDANKSFAVEVKDNKSNNINVNKSDLSVMNGNQSISFEYTGTLMTIKEALPVGNYNLTINYLGNENYINSTKIISMKVYGNNTIETVTSVVCDGKNVEIPVTINNGLENITELIKSNFNLTLVYTNETGNVTNIPITDFNIENGKIKFASPVELISASVIINYVNATVPKTVAVKVSTEVKAEKDEYKFKSEENKTISIIILSGENQLNVVKNDLKVFDNGNEITNFKFNDTNLTYDWTIGVHNLRIVYNGDAKYASNETNIVLKVGGNQIINPQETADIDSDKKVNIYLNLSDGADLVDVNLDNLNVTVFWKVGNQTMNKTIAKNEITLADDNQTISFVFNEEFESAYADIKYAAENNLTGKTTIKVGTAITSEDSLERGQGQSINFTVEVKTVDGTPIEINTNNIKILNNGKEVKFTCNNSVITITDTLKFGNYNLTIKYIGNSTYDDSTKNILISIYGINATSSTNVNSTKKGEVKVVDVLNGDGSVNVTAEDFKDSIVIYKVGNDTKNITVTIDKIENKTLYFTLAEGNFTTATLILKYRNTTANVTLNRIYNVNITVINGINEYKAGNFTFKLTDIDAPDEIIPEGSKFSLTTMGNIRAGHTGTTNAEGIISYRNANLYEYSGQTSSGTIDLSTRPFEVGNHEVELSTSDNIKSTTLKVNLTITKATVNINIAKYSEYYGTDKNITITVTNAKTGEAVSGTILKLYMPETSGKTYYVQTDSNGIGRISAKNLVGGDYKLTVSNNDTKNINSASKDSTVTIKKIPVTLSAKDVTIQYNSGTTATIKVTKNGKALNGVYVLVRLYTTSSKYNDYLFQTNKKGQISFSASLNVGKHKMIISSADTRYDFKQTTKTITVKKASAKFTAKKATTYYKAGKYFTVKLTNSKNKKAIYNAKLNIKVYVSKTRYYNYNGNTGTNGKLKLKITLKPGTYKVEVSGADNKNFAAKKVTSKIVVKKAPTKFIAKKLTAKKGKKKFFKITAKNKKTKKVISGLKIKVKVKTGKKTKTYNLKTNKKGIAKLNVKKLKVGKHKVTIKSANKYCVAKTKKSTIKIKK